MVPFFLIYGLRKEQPPHNQYQGTFSNYFSKQRGWRGIFFNARGWRGSGISSQFISGYIGQIISDLGTSFTVFVCTGAAAGTGRPVFFRSGGFAGQETRFPGESQFRLSMQITC